MAPIRPLLRFAGSKFSIRHRITPFFPAHSTYIEAFGGIGAILLNKPPVQVEIWSDLDRDLFALMTVVKTRLPEFLERLPRFGYVAFAAAQAIDSTDPMELAVARFVMGRMTWGGIGKVFVDGKKAVDSYGTMPPVLHRISQRLQNVQLANVDALDLIPQHDKPEVLMYLDPDYPTASRCDWYAHIVNPVKLANVLLGLRHAKVVLSNYPDSPYNQLLPGWKRKDLRNVLRPVASPFTLTGVRPRNTESLYLNFDPKTYRK